MAYENKSNWTLGENKPNSNPNKPNFRRAQMNVNLLITKDYRKKDDFAVQKNKPNQTQFFTPLIRVLYTLRGPAPNFGALLLKKAKYEKIVKNA